MSNKLLNVKFGADTTSFKKGTNEVRAELTELNSAMRINKREQKELNDEIKKLEKQQKELKSAMSQVKKPTKEMTDEADRLQKALDEATLKAAKLKTEEQELKGKISSATKELKEQSDSAEKNSVSMEKVGETVKKVATLLASGMVALFTYSAKMAATADEINTIAKQTGLATDEIQKFMYSSELIDVSLETLTGSMSKLIRNMNAATKGTGDAYDAFKALGVSITDDLTGNLRNNQDVFDEVIEKLGTIEDTTQRDAYAMAIFGKSAQELNPLILGGTEQLRQFGDELEREGLILDQMQLDKLNAFNDKIDSFKAKFQAKMMESSVDWTDAFDELLDETDAIVDLVATLITGFAKITGFIVDHKEAVLAVVVAYTSLKVVMNVTSLITSVISVVRTLTVATNGATTAQLALNTAMRAAPYVALAAGAVKLISKFTNLKQTSKDTSDEIENVSSTVDGLRNSVENAVVSAQSEICILQIKAERYEELRNKVSLTAQEEQELYNIACELENTYPDEIKLIDSKTQSYLAMGNQIDELTEKMLINARVAATQDALSQAYIDKAESERYIQGERDELSKLENADYSKWYDPLLGMWVSPISSQAKRRGEATRDTRKNIEKAEKELQEINEYIEEIEAELEEAYSNGFIEQMNKNIEAGSKQSISDEEETVELTTELKELKSAYEMLLSAEKELKDENKISLETLEKITAKYPELTGVVDDYIAGLLTGTDVINRLELAYKNDVNKYQSSVEEKMKTDERYFRYLRDTNDSYINTLANQYGIDLRNYKNYADAKLAIENAFLSAKAKNWASYYDIESGTYKISSKDIMQLKKELVASGMSEKEANAYISDYKQDYWNTVNAVNDWNKLSEELNNKTFSSFNQFISSNSNASSSTNNTGSSSKKEVSIYDQARESYMKLVKDRIAEIEDLTKAEVAGADKRIAAIESEIEARKKLADTEDVQKRIDYIKAQLKYSMLDDFERYELQKQLDDIEKEQSDKMWEEGKRAEIEAIETEKNSIEDANKAIIEDLNNRMNYANTLFADLNNGYKAPTTIANNNSKSANITIVENALTVGQVTQVVKDALGIEVIF